METQITTVIKTYEDACKMLDIDPELSLPFSGDHDGDQLAINATFKLIKIAKALNEGWTPDWQNDDERKYYPWMDMEDDNGSGLGLSFTDYDYVYSYSLVGSRLCFKSRELAEYAGRQFVGLYAEAWIIKGN